ncbi:universal stress protein [Pseudomonas sp. dw_358]|uniref:universal stress protein n=1 Tax=Pseudomonas sp. dw_358 TaxID=2720083 RepID=UPI001BD618BB|nr:universal stress protein [Pseudomonas sp. dw_358]
MQGIRSILVVLESAEQHDLALARGRLIAGVTQAHLHLLMCDRSQDHSTLLTELKLHLLDQGYSTSAEQAWAGSLHETIIGVQQAEGCDLVIKRHRAEQSLKKALLTPVDWKLLRECPSAVLMVKTERPWQGANILAAVDVGNPDDEHQHLHNGIIDHGYGLAQLAKGALHVISAHPSPMLSAPDPLAPRADSVEARYRQACQAFQAQFDIDDQHLHIAEGPADELIPYMAHKLEAAITVIGTVARSGLSGALIGNTAEAVLDSLESDVLVLKNQEIIHHLVALAQR